MNFGERTESPEELIRKQFPGPLRTVWREVTFDPLVNQEDEKGLTLHAPLIVVAWRVGHPRVENTGLDPCNTAIVRAVRCGAINVMGMASDLPAVLAHKRQPVSGLDALWPGMSVVARLRMLRPERPIVVRFIGKEPIA